MTVPTMQEAAQDALQRMLQRGFEHAQVGAGRTFLTELNIAHNEASLLRSTEEHRLTLLGIIGGRKAEAQISALSGEAVQARIDGLLDEVRVAPQDDANAVSAGQLAAIEQGPLQADTPLLAAKVRELLQFRAAETPKMMLDEGSVAHTCVEACTLTSSGSVLTRRLGWHGITVFGTAREGKRSSSFAYAAGRTHALEAGHAVEHFGIGELLRATERQIDAAPLGGSFVGEVVLMPEAVVDLMRWLQGQLSDVQLISGASLYKDQVGQRIASPQLTLASRFDAPGVAAISADGFATPPVRLLEEGRLLTLIPSLYGSRKTGLPHVPIASSGWELAAGVTPRAELIRGVARGALVGRLSMGMPAANGDFSGVIKNSFLIEDGQVGRALSETMVAGNIARMLRDVTALSCERIDTGAWRLPWLRVGGLHFS